MLNPTLFEENLQAIKEDIAINPSIINLSNHLSKNLDESTERLNNLVDIAFHKGTEFENRKIGYTVPVHAKYQYIFLPDGALLKKIGSKNLDCVHQQVSEIQRKNVDRLLMYPMREKPYTEMDEDTLTIKFNYTSDVLASAWGYWSYVDPYIWYTYDAAIVKICLAESPNVKLSIRVNSFPYRDNKPSENKHSWQPPYHMIEMVSQESEYPDLSEVCADTNNLYVDIFKKLNR